MAGKLTGWFIKNRKLIMITAELFWIAVFLLDQISNSNAVDIPQFIYVNF